MKKLTTRRILLFAITLTVSLFTFNSCDEDDDGAGDVPTQILPDISVEISSNPRFLVEGETAVYTFENDIEPDAISAYAWTFPGGIPATSTEAMPSVTYDTAGMFGTTLTITRAADGMQFSGEFDITVFESASTAFMSDVQTVEQGEQVVFRSMSAANDNLMWTFEGGDPDTSTEEEVVVTYVTAGTFDVTLASSLNGTTETVTETDFITVTQQAGATFSASATEINQNQSITFSNTTPTTDASVRWGFTGGDISSSTDNEVTVTYANAGEFDVTLEVTKNGITNTIEEVGFVTVQAATAILQSAETNRLGSQVILTYDIPLNDPSAETITVEVDGMNAPVASILLDDTNNTQIVALLSTPITSTGATITVSHPNPVVTTVDGGALPVLTDAAVTNNFFDTSGATNLFLKGDFESASTTNYDVNNNFQGSGNVGALSADFVGGVGVGNSRALVWTITGGTSADSRALFGDADQSDPPNTVNLITPMSINTTYFVKARIKFTGTKPTQFELGSVNFPFAGFTLVFADLNLTGVTEGADFVEVGGTFTTVNDGRQSAESYAIPRLRAGNGDSVVTIDNIEVFEVN